jgi:hypothetical protein
MIGGRAPRYVIGVPSNAYLTGAIIYNGCARERVALIQAATVPTNQVVLGEDTAYKGPKHSG